MVERQPPRVWARIVSPDGKSGTILHRTEWLTPYTAETISEDARRAGRGAGLDVTVAADATLADVARVRERFAPLLRLGIRVNVRRRDRSEVRPLRLDGNPVDAPPARLDLPVHARRSRS